LYGCTSCPGGTDKLKDVSHAEVQAWVARDGRTRGLVRVQRAACPRNLGAVPRLAVRERRLASKPVAAVRLPSKVGRNKLFLTMAQVDALATGCEPYSLGCGS